MAPMVPTARPARQTRNGPIPPNAFRVLLTGFGPFSVYESNPSWEAVSALHDTIISIDNTHERASAQTSMSRSLHITAINVPVVYSTVLSAVPMLHRIPPEITLPVPDGGNDCPSPAEGYDFIFHVGVGLSGALAVEQLAHKTGYNRPDVDGKPAPLIEDSMKQAIMSLGIDNKRGFGKGYEQFPDELQTSIEVERLVENLKQQGYRHVRLSTDPGRFLCDFIYYCSLAESRRSRLPASSRHAKVLFMHVPPVNQPYTVEEMSSAVEEVVWWIASTHRDN